MAGSGGALGSAWSPGDAAALLPLGRPGTLRHFCVAGVALGDSDVRFAWQAWRFCVASVALMGLGWVLWRAWVRLVVRDAAALLRGRRGACGTVLALVACHTKLSHTTLAIHL